MIEARFCRPSLRKLTKGLTVSRAASPLDALGILFSSELAYCTRAAISSVLSAMSKMRTSSIRPEKKLAGSRACPAPTY